MRSCAATHKPVARRGAGKGSAHQAVVDQVAHDGRIRERRRVAQLLVLVGRDLAQDPPHDLARPGLRQARGPLDVVRGGDGADLFTGDGCRRDADGYYWITGRVDDVINVSGHRMGTAEVESALVAHEKVAEAAVVGYPHEIKGQGIYAYVTLMKGTEPTEALRKELEAWVRTEIGPIAKPDLIQWAPGLPKTRSGKIMRRILRKIAENDFGALGDTSTLADPSVVDDLIANRMNRG